MVMIAGFILTLVGVITTCAVTVFKIKSTVELAIKEVAMRAEATATSLGEKLTMLSATIDKLSTKVDKTTVAHYDLRDRVQKLEIVKQVRESQEPTGSG